MTNQQNFGQITTVEFGGQICFCPPLVAQTGTISVGLYPFSCFSLLRVGCVQINTFSMYEMRKNHPNSQFRIDIKEKVTEAPAHHASLSLSLCHP